MNKVSQSEFEDKLIKLFPEESISIITYTKMSSPCTYKCNICGHQETIYRAGDLTRKKHLCNKCWYGIGSGKETKKQQIQAVRTCENHPTLDFVEFGYNKRLLKNTIKFKCLRCQSVAEFQLNYFLKNPHCPHCTYNAKHLTTTGVQINLPDDYTLLSEYKSCDNPILIRHEKCHFIWKTTIHNFMASVGCPKCNKSMSKGERKILEWLSNNNINFLREHSFEWIGRRRYDFYLPDFNVVIEYMGIQHYQEVPHFNLSLQRQQEIDLLKKREALKHGLSYIDISYLDYDILETVLAQRLSQLGVGIHPETESTLPCKGEDIV